MTSFLDRTATQDRSPNATEMDPVRPLSSRQRMIWTAQQLDPGVPLFNMIRTFTINAELDVDAFRAAFGALVDRCDALRTVIDERDGTPVQRVVGRYERELPLVDLSGADDPELALAEQIAERGDHMFEPGDLLFDTVLFRLGPARFVWFLNQHHLIADAWSASLLLRYQADLYERARDGRLDEAPTLPSYGDFLAAEDETLSSDEYAEAAQAWSDKLQEPFEPLSFYGRASADAGPATVRIEAGIDGDRAERLARFMQRPDIAALSPELTGLRIFHTVLFGLLHRLTGHDRLAIGTPFHNRLNEQFRHTVGLFMNLFPLTVDVRPDETMASLMQQVGREAFEGMQRARFPVSAAHEANAFEVVLNYIHAPFERFGDLPAEARWHHCGYGDPAHAIRVQVLPDADPGSFRLYFDLKDGVFDDEQRGLIVDHFFRVLDAWLDDPGTSLTAIELPTGDERARILASSTVDGPAASDTIPSRFAEQLAQHAERIAVADDEQSLTYAELDARAELLADRLTALGAGPDRVVALCSARTVDMIVGMLGIQKAGAAYMPLAPNDPPDRRRRMVASSNSVAVVVHEPTAHVVAGLDLPIVRIDDPEHGASAAAPRSELRPHHLAYVLFTSGTTGEPKATMIEHRNVVNLVGGLHERVYGPCVPTAGEGLRVALVAPYVFDPSVQQIFAALLGGHTLVIVPDEARTDGDRLRSFLEAHRIDVSDGTPGHVMMLAGAGAGDLASLPVQHFIIGGEALAKPLVRRFFDRFTTRVPALTNAYGPAECCVDSVTWSVTPDNLDDFDTVPIGRPMPGASVYVLDPHGNLQPFGVAGELCIGGSGVGRGYVDGDEASDERFVDNPFGPGRLYRTGDLARQSADGVIEFLGRRDSQVKVRGHRLEVEEVEAALRRFRVRRTHVPVTSAAPAAPVRCSECLLSEQHPGVVLDEAGVCSVCREFVEVGSEAGRYFGTIDDLAGRLARAADRGAGEHDCLLLYSGGKDSSYVLHRLVEMGLRVLAYTFDNGHISPAAFRNIERQTARLGVESVVTAEARMDDIFVESLNDDSTVCSGCFKALTTASTRLAHERGINAVVTGLSRGQIFDTKVAGLLGQGVRDVGEIEEKLRLFRMAYHANRDRTAALLDVDVEGIDLDEIDFVDFFRYDDIATGGVRAYLQERDAYWRQPDDTGFCSSNCRMNDIGIAVHSADEGYHNYEAPLSWDIRLGVTTREQALEEVTPVTNVRHVNRVLDRIGYSVREIHDAAVVAHPDPSGNLQLWAYFVASQSLSVAELRSHLARALPEYAIPARFVQVDQMPLNENGKIDKARLRPDDDRPTLGHRPVQPKTPAERELAAVWSDVLGIDAVGVHDNYFELGGDSINAIQIVARAGAVGWQIAPRQIFEQQTVHGLASVATPVADDEDSPDDRHEPEPFSMVSLAPEELERLGSLFDE